MALNKVEICGVNTARRPQKIRAGALFLKAKNSEDLYANKNTIGAFEWEKFC